MLKEKNRNALLGVAVICALAAAAPLYPLFGDPPAVFMVPLKWFLAGASLVSVLVACLWQSAAIPTSALSVFLSFYCAQATLKPSEWVPFYWSAVIVFGLSMVLMFVGASKALDED